MGKQSTLQEQLSKARNELELSTFLNKGVLQTNSEQKLRIAELEVENAALRKAESLLANTEEERDDALQRVTELQATIQDLGERLRGAEDEMVDFEERARQGDKAVARLGSLERSLRRASDAAEGWKVKFETLLAAVNASQRIFAEATPSRETERVPFSPVSTRTPSQPAEKSPRSGGGSGRSSSRKRRIVESSDESEEESDVKSKFMSRLRKRDEAGREGTRVLPHRERRKPPALPGTSLDSPTRVRMPTPHVREGKRKKVWVEVEEVAVKSEPESDHDPLGSWDD